MTPAHTLFGPSSRKRNQRPGVVLFSVLVVTAILILVSYQFFNVMQAEFAATIASNKVLQSRHLAESGLNYVSFVLAHPETAGLSADGTSPIVFSPLVYDNPELFHQRPVTGPDGNPRGYFSVVSVRDTADPLAQSDGFRFGVEDESGKINLTTLVLTDRDNRAKNILSRLPGMNEDSADALLKWIKPSDGSDSLNYTAMGYAPKNGPFESLEELLLVRTITPRMLLGNDRNRNGRLEPDEDDSGGVLDPGLARYVTLYSRELNLDSTGQPRLYINDSTDLQALQGKLAAILSPEVVDFIMWYRIIGPPSGSQGGSSGGGGLARIIQQPKSLPEGVTIVEGKLVIDYAKVKPARDGTLTSMFSLIDAEILVSQPQSGRGGGGGGRGGGGGGGGQQQQTVRFRSPLRKDDKGTLRTLLPVLLDKLTISQEQELPARVNLNTAPPDVIKAFPNITDADLEKIMTYRASAETDPSLAPVYTTLAWLVTEADMDVANVRDYEQYFTAQSQVFRFQAVGYYEVNGPATRIEAVVDTNGGRPRLLYWRDISNLGRGFQFSQYQPTLP